MWPTPKGFTRVNNLVHIAMWLTPDEYYGVIMFCLWEKFSQRVCHIQIRMYFANFYVNNALHGATLAYCSHFQYVSRSRLRVIQIGVKDCIDVTLYDEPFVTSIIEKHILIPLRIILTVVQWSTPRSLLYSLAKLSGRVYNRSGTQHGILYRTYGWGVGNDFHSLSIFCHGRALSLYSISHLVTLARTLSLKNSVQTLLYAFQKILHHFGSTICHSQILIRKAVVLPLTFL